MIIIPIGVDCGVAGFLNKYGLRKCSYPFDWVVSYNGVSKCFEDNFTSFIPDVSGELVFNKYDMSFVHDFSINKYEEDKIKYTRRCLRLTGTLETTQDIVLFLRKGHWHDMHDHHGGRFKNISNDLSEAEEFVTILSKKYPNLNYICAVILQCGICFDRNKTYTSTSDRIIIRNIAKEYIDDEEFERACLSI